MELIKLFIKRYVGTFLIIGILTGLGIIASFNLPVSYYPDFSVPALFITTVYPGADPESVENDVTQIIEESLSAISGIEEISSTTQEGFSTVTVNFAFGVDIKEKTRSVQEKIDQIRPVLPRNAQLPVILTVSDFLAAPIELSITSTKRSLSELKLFVENRFAPQISRLNGVANTTITGGVDTIVKIEIDPLRLVETGIPFNSLERIISGANSDFPIGDIQGDKKAFTLRLQGRYSKVEDIENIFIGLTQGQSVRLKDIAKISVIEKTQTKFSRTNLSNSIGLIVRKPSGGNSIQIAEEVKRYLKQNSSKLPSDIVVKIVKDESLSIQSAITSVFVSLMLGAILAALVIFLFLGNIRNTLVIVLSIPTTLMITFLLMKVFKLSLNTVSLGGMGMAVGMIVDSAIVVMENAFRFLENEKDRTKRLDTITKSAAEVGLAISASVLTTVVVFFPLTFTQGLANVLLGELSMVIVFALIISIFIAITLVPVLSYFLLTTEYKPNIVSIRFNNLTEFLKGRYVKLLSWSLKNRIKTILAFTVLMVVGFVFFSNLSTGLLPNNDQGEFQIIIDFPKGTSVSYTNQRITEIEKKLLSLNNIKYVTSVIGEDLFFGSLLPYSGTLTVISDLGRPTGKIIDEVRNIFKNYSGFSYTIRIIDATAGIQRNEIDIVISGNDIPVLQKQGDLLISQLSAIKGVTNLKSNLSKGVPSYIFIPDREKISNCGLSVLELAQIIRGSKSGQTVTKYKLDNYDVDVEIVLEEADKFKISKIENIPIFTNRAGVVPLKALGRFVEGDAPSEIKRISLRRIVNVTGDIDKNYKSSTVKKQISGLIKSIKLPRDYTISQKGSSRAIGQSFSTLGIALLIGIILVYVVMGLQFNSFKIPFVIALSIPYSLLGASISLFITKNPLNLPSFLGLIVLAGIVVNNGIILLEFVIQFKNKYDNLNEAIIDAGKIRFRPILMTTLTTILGMLFLALNIGGGGESLVPLAVSVMGGLTYSIFVSLVFIPVLFTYFDRNKVIRDK